MCVLGNKLIEKNKVLKNFDINIKNAYNLIRKQFISYKIDKK